MKTVRIVNGTYGQRVNNRTVPVRLGGVCRVDEQEAARLVGLGVAAYVEEAPAGAPAQADEDAHEDIPAQEDEEAREDAPKPAKAKKSGRAKTEPPMPELAPEDPVT